ncbi:MAG: DUF2812 domain-containing protein [Dysosmobacter sp.]|nr:DUF2812 domain-containing protein [Dysosmobacter sp.]
MTEERFMKDAEYKELRPANVYDVAANESWLEDMAKQGYRLKGMTGWSGIFEKAEPFSCRYRMQPLSKKEKHPPEETVEGYRELGWEYAGTIPGTFHVWRCEDPAAPELDTDPVVQGMGYRYLRGKMQRSAVVDGLLLAVLVALYVWAFANTSTPLLDTLEAIPGRILAGVATGCLIVMLIACEVRSMRRLLRSLNAGIPLDRPRPYRWQKWMARGLLAGMVFIWLTMLLGNIRAIDGGSLSGGWDNMGRDGAPKDGTVYVDLADLEGAAATEIWRSRTKFQELCPRMYRTAQLSLDSEEEELQPGDSLPVRASAETTYYRMLTEGLARQLTEELTRRRIASFGVDGHPVLTEVETDALDGLWWGEDRYYQFAVARLGRQVLFVQYEGDSDLRQEGAYFASLLT